MHESPQPFNQLPLWNFPKIHACGVTLQLISLTSPHQLGRRHIEKLALEIQHRHVQPGHCAHHDTFTGKVQRRSPTMLPCRFVSQGIPSNQQRYIKRAYGRLRDLSGAITPLQERFSEAAALLRQRCAERLRGGQVSSFIVGGRDGVPLEPGELLPSPLYMMEEPVVPARGGRQEHTPAESADFIGFDEQGQPHIRGWPLPGFSQAWLNLECAGWLME